MNQQEYLQAVTDRLIKQIEDNNAPWQRPFEPGDYSFTDIPVNVKGKPYSGMNMLHLMSVAQERGFTDNRWLTFNGAKELGGKVLKGEKASDIYYWKFTDTITANKKDKEGNEIIGENGKPVKIKIEVKLDKPRVFFAKVFNADQLEGLPPREQTVKKLEEWERHEIAERILKNSGVPIIHKVGEQAYYSPSQDHIVLPERTQFKSSDLYYATALHELGHATGHESRLSRDLSGGFGSEDYAKEELRAEISSMMVGQELQIGHDPSQHVAYLQSWAKVVKNDPKEIFKAVKDADAIYKYVLSLDPERAKEIVEDLEAGNITQDPEIISSMEERHNQTKLENEHYSTAFETYKNLKDFIAEAELPYNVIASRADHGYTLNYYDGERKTDITTEVYSLDGKALTSFAEPRIEDTYYTNDSTWQRQSLTKALSLDVQQQKNLVNEAIKEVQEDIENLKIYINVPFKEKNEAKGLGAKWDKENKSWFITKDQDLSKFSKWLDQKTLENDKTYTAKLYVRDYDQPNKIDSNLSLNQLKDLVSEHGLTYKMALHDSQDNELINIERTDYSSLGINKQPELFLNVFQDGKNDPELYKAVKQALTEAGQQYGLSPIVNDEKFDQEISLNKYTENEKVYLYTIPSEKEELKDLGAKWDKLNQVWYTSSQNDLSKFSKWLDRPDIPGPEETFAKFLKENQIAVTPGHPKMDGKAYRLANEGSDKKNVLYQLYPNHGGVPSGRVTNFSRGADPEKWTYPMEYIQRQQNIDAVDRVKYGSEYKPEVKQVTIEYSEPKKEVINDLDTKEIHAQTAEKVKALFSFTPIAKNHDYLDKKGVSSNNLLRIIPDKKDLPEELADKIVIANDWREAKLLRENIDENRLIVQKDSLIVPQFNKDRELRSFETIGYNGAKYALTNAEKKGLSLQIGTIENGKPFILAEGYATGATLHEQANKIPSVIAFGKGGLLQTAEQYRAEYPDSKIYIAADNDHQHELEGKENTGLEEAKKVAQAVNAHVLIPKFNPGDKGKDWNDVFIDQGVHEFRSQLKNQLEAIAKIDPIKKESEVSVKSLENLDLSNSHEKKEQEMSR